MSMKKSSKYPAAQFSLSHYLANMGREVPEIKMPLGSAIIQKIMFPDPFVEIWQPYRNIL
jgi:hypothetical protein